MTDLRIVTLSLSISSVLFVAFVTIYVCKHSRHEITLSSLSVRCGVASKRLTFKYVTQTAKFCQSADNRTTALIGVLSRTDNFEARAAIRDTWGGTALKMGFVVVFLLGKVLDQEVQRGVSTEQDIYGDIIQGDFIDTYRNLTYKTVMLIRWAREKCSETHFVLKIDDDMLLGVWDFVIAVNDLAGIKRSMWGYLYRGFRPVRNVTSKWYVSRKEYAPDTYPDFLSGTGYLISGDSISALEDLTHYECFFPLEDIYLTAIVAARAQVSRLGLDGFSYKHNLYHQACSTPRIVTSHKWSPIALRSAWKRAVSRLDLAMCVGINRSHMVF